MNKELSFFEKLMFGIIIVIIVIWAFANNF